MTSAIKVFFRNIQGLKAKIPSITKKLREENAAIAAFVEAYMTDVEAQTRPIEGYHCYNRQRDHGTQNRGGASIFVRDDGTFKHTLIHKSPNGAMIESITIVMCSQHGDNVTYITCAYAPPPNNSKKKFKNVEAPPEEEENKKNKDISKEDFIEALPISLIPVDAKWLILMDANAHSKIWDSILDEDSRGDTLIEVMVEEDLQCENDPYKPTRSYVSKKGIKHSSPDVTLTRNLGTLGWDTEADANSDHNWIKFELDGVTSGQLRSTKRYWCMPKARWDLYKVTMDKLMGLLPCKRIENVSKAMLQAMRATVPRGTRKEHVPLWTDKMEEAQVKSQKADATLRADCSELNLALSKKAKVEMLSTFREERRKHFFQRFQESKGSREMWRLLKTTQPKPNISTNTMINSVNGDLKTDKQKATAFVKKFANVSRRKGPIPPKVRMNSVARDLTMDEFLCSLKKMAKGKAVGIDELPIEAVLYLSEEARKGLLEAMNYSYIHGDVPLVWRRGCIIPVLKPDKNAAELDSYRPVTLTSQISKLMERMIARRIIYEIHPHLHSSQYGFRAGLSTVDALMEIVDEIVRAFDHYERYEHDGTGQRHTYERALAVMVDYSSAFDTIGHHAVLQQLENMGCGQFELRWVRSFLSGRQGKVVVNETSSDWKDFESGVPQGTVLGPLLFIVAINDLLGELHATGIKCVTFADDVTLIARNMSVDDCIEQAQIALDIIDRWTHRSCMEVNIKKTFGILFTKSHNKSPFDSFTKKLTYRGKEIIIFVQQPPKKKSTKLKDEKKSKKTRPSNQEPTSDSEESSESEDSGESDGDLPAAVNTTRPLPMVDPDGPEAVGVDPGMGSIPQLASAILPASAIIPALAVDELTFAQSRLLGIHYDRMLTFFRQVQKVRKGVTKSRQALSRLSGATFGADRKQLCEFHTVFSRSKELYGVEVYHDSIRPNQRNALRLQTVKAFGRPSG